MSCGNGLVIAGGLFPDTDVPTEVIPDGCDWRIYARPVCTVYVPSGYCLEFGTQTDLNLPFGLTGLNNLSPWSIEVEANTYDVDLGIPTGKNQGIFASFGTSFGDANHFTFEHVWRNPGPSHSWGVGMANNADWSNTYTGLGTGRWTLIKVTIDPLTNTGSVLIIDVATSTILVNAAISPTFLASVLPAYTHADYALIADSNVQFNGIIRNIRYYQDSTLVAYFPVDEGWTTTGDPVFEQENGNDGVQENITDGQWLTCP